MNRSCACGQAICDWNLGTCPREPAGPLRRQNGPDGPRDMLVGRPVECGNFLEVLIGDPLQNQGRYVTVRYEMQGRDAAAVYHHESEVHEVTDRHRFRWPVSTGY